MLMASSMPWSGWLGLHLTGRQRSWDDANHVLRAQSAAHRLCHRPHQPAAGLAQPRLALDLAQPVAAIA